jgi:hypothetical protein
MGKEKEPKEKKPFYKRWWFFTIIAVVIIGAAAGGDDEEVAEGDTSVESNNNITESDEETEESNNETEENMNNNEGNSESNSETNNEDTAVDEDGDEAPVSGVGEAVQVGDVEYTINDVDTTKEVGNEYLSETTNDVFVIVNVTAENVGTDSVNLSSSDLKLILNENTYDSDSTASLYANDDDMGLFLESINPGSSIEANVAFDVTPDVAEDPDLMVQTQQGLLFPDTALIRLND